MVDETMSSEDVGTIRHSWPWADSLDALVAAPNNHTLLFENEFVRVVHTRILPVQTVPVHTHRWPSVLFIMTWSDMIRLDPEGNLLLDTRKASEAPQLNTPAWQEPLPPHSVMNVGLAEINTVQVEVKAAHS
jgi:hypothetical protein